VVVDEPDWSRIFEERFKMQISNSRREKTYTMYSNENEHLGYIQLLILHFFTIRCEMLGKGIPQRKNSENDIDMFIKRHIFACFDDILDTH
ncbi:hypothetical protein RhiirB3_404613, partial [Rhizophagus irregularis]